VCGRYASARPARELAEVFGVSAAAVEGELSADYNVAPTKPVLAVVERRPRPDDDAAGGGDALGSADAGRGRAQPPGAERADPERRLMVMRWGLVPSWAKDPSIGNRLVNARAETVAEKPAFRRAFARRRCLLPADGYYEWWNPETPGRRKQPFFIHPRDGSVLALAGLYEFWRPDEDADWLVTCTVLTTSAPDEVGRIHPRAPLTVGPDDWERWLDPEVPGEQVAGLLVPAVPGVLDAYPVSTAVNNVRNNGPDLLDPIEADGAWGGARGDAAAPDQPALPLPEPGPDGSG
jgi:putative SOS response-associated peptidase YedK